MMMAASLFTSAWLFSLAVAKALPDHAFLYERAPDVPQATPTGSACGNGGNAVPSLSPLAVPDVAGAVEGCQGITLTGQTRNDIVDGICKPFTLIFARGTTETGNLGSIVGPPFVDALEMAFGKNKVAVQGVNDYPADTNDYCAGGSLSGSQNMAKVSPLTLEEAASTEKDQLVKQTMKQCPKTKLCISGYSQGAQVVHNAAEILQSNAAATKFINSVVTFGDPDRKLPVGNVPDYKVDVICHKGDNICENGDVIKPEHLTYCQDVGSAAAFAKRRSKAAN